VKNLLVLVAPLFALGGIIMFITGVIASLASPDPALSLNHMFRFVFAGLGLPIAFLWWRPKRNVVVALCLAFVLGCVVSTLDAVVSGPEAATGRYVGLTTHFNFFGLAS
jgi:hypothetical protein